VNDLALEAGHTDFSVYIQAMGGVKKKAQDAVWQFRTYKHKEKCKSAPASDRR
jgi:hypothetical protein